MLTPQEVHEKKFVKAMFGGYDMVTVDQFLEQLTEDYTSLYKENAVLKNKLKVLVDTVEEYRGVDDSMRKALLSAQKIATDLVEDAKGKAAEIVESATKTANTKHSELLHNISLEKMKLQTASEQTESFISSVRDAFIQHLEMLDKLPEMINDEHDPQAELAENVQKNILMNIPDSSVSTQNMMPEPYECSSQNIEKSEDQNLNQSVSILELKQPFPQQEPSSHEIKNGNSKSKPFDFEEIGFDENYTAIAKT